MPHPQTLIQVNAAPAGMREKKGMNASSIARSQAKVPRYTSYPTAPHFNADVSPDTYADWLARLDGKAPVSLYLHVPFCAEMCWYCGCFTKIVNRYDPVREYADALLAEAALVSERAGKPLSVSFVHWGGGSPTMLKADDWRRMMDGLRERFAFAPDADVAVEMDPRTTTRDYVGALKAAGVTRVSIGVQDFDAEVQQAINRVQPFEVTRRVVDWLRDAGIDSINLDLMYGLPHQSTERVVSMVARALEFEPDRIALFGYAHVPWMKSHQRLIPEHALPDAESRWRQYEIASGMLSSAGFERIGFDHFAHPADTLATASRDGRLARNFQGYTADGADTLIGLGASAIGTLPQGYVQNVAAIKEYVNRVQGGELATSRGRRLTDADRLRRDVINAVMCDLDVDVGALCRRHGFREDELDTSLGNLDAYGSEGLLDLQDRRIRVSERGRPLVRLIAAAFDAYLETGQAKHSVAV